MPTRDSYPTGWPGNYVGDNFDESLKYQVQLEIDGKGIYTPDPNESHFTNLTRVRRLIENLLGDVAIREAFKIVGTGASNDFNIVGGDDTLLGALRFYLRGYEVLILGDTTYATQQIDLNDSLVSAEPALNTPSGGDRTDEIYLEIGLEQVTGIEDPPSVPPSEGTSVSNRLRLMAKVKVAEGSTTPVDFQDGSGIDRHTVKLATLERFDGQDVINVADFTDVRISMDKAALGGNQEGAGKAPFNPSSLKIFSQDTPDNTVQITTSAIMITSDGLRVIDVLPQISSAFSPASLSTKTRFYNVHLDQACLATLKMILDPYLLNRAILKMILDPYDIR